MTDKADNDFESKELLIAGIVTDAGTQVRVDIDQEVVTEYARLLAGGTKLPDPDVFYDGSRYLLADGSHRILAHLQKGDTKLWCKVHKGDFGDALEYALLANHAHGLRLTNADKHHAIQMALARWPNTSAREIARRCGVSHNFVAGFLNLNQSSSDDNSEQPRKRTGKDGKSYKAKHTKKSKPKPEPKAEAEPTPTEAARGTASTPEPADPKPESKASAESESLPAKAARPATGTTSTTAESTTDATYAKATTAATPVKFDAGLVPLKELRELAVKLYNCYHNSTKGQEVERVLWKLKESLAVWAEWQVKLSGGQNAA